MYLLDTNICIYTINSRPKHVVEKVKSFEPPMIKLSSISVGELEYGVSKSPNREKNRMALLNFLSGFDIMDFDDRDAEVFGIIRARLEQEGQIIGPYDLQIASQAIARNYVLVTNNVKEFERIRELRIENWANFA
jgi:tRNA(fMet)-specific endonuclease VapC